VIVVEWNKKTKAARSIFRRGKMYEVPYGNQKKVSAKGKEKTRQNTGKKTNSPTQTSKKNEQHRPKQDQTTPQQPRGL